MTNLNVNKNIGKVIYVVEGERKEINLLRHIFTKVLDYNVVTRSRGSGTFCEYFQNPRNTYSQIFVVNSGSSSLTSIDSDIGDAYLDAVFEHMYETYGITMENAAVYYIFDRDRNNDTLITKLLKKLGNARDNGIEANGLLLLSYPSIESYVISCFSQNMKQLSVKSKTIKKYLDDNAYNQDQIGDKGVRLSFDTMKKTVDTMIGVDLAESWLDDFSQYNIDIYDKESRKYSEDACYRLLSLLSLSFFDLGIITID